MENIRKFETEADVMMFIQPNIVLVADTGKVLYNVDAPKGVFIQHIDGSLFTTNDWTAGGYSNAEANGVAILDTEAKFVISKKNVTANSGKPKWGDAVLINNIVTTTSSATAKKDYAGFDNTAGIIKQASNTWAAYHCNAYVFPNGQKGYLPALGEWIIAHKYYAAINNAMSLIGGTSLGFSWSSTQYNKDYAWYFDWTSGRVDYTYYTKEYTGYLFARPFTVFQLPT